MQIIAFAIATVIPLVVLMVIRALDLYGTGSMKVVVTCVVWGAAAYAGAYFANTAAYDLLKLDDWNTVARFIAPPVEEILKALILIYLVRQPKFTYFVDGAIFGFAVGIGFAVAENFQYILESDAGLMTAVGRVISTNLIHGSATALTGVVLGLARFQKPLPSVFTALAGLAAAICLHLAFNNMVALVADGPVLLFAAVIAMLAVGLIVFLIFRGLGQSRQWIEQQLGTGDRVTMGEAKVVRRYEDMHDLLKPVRDMFGEEKAAQIEQLLNLQARIGIKRGALEKLQDERMQRASQAEIDTMNEQMEKLRRSIGAYTMLAVRQIIPENTSPLWDMLRNRIQQSIENRPASGGANLFASLGQKMQAAKPKPAEDQPPASNP